MYYLNISISGVESYSSPYSIVMVSRGNNQYELSELITNYDFSKANEIALSFWYYDNQDNDNTGSDHTGHQNADAVYYTCNGNRWYFLQNLQGSTTWQQVTMFQRIQISAQM